MAVYHTNLAAGQLPGDGVVLGTAQCLILHQQYGCHIRMRACVLIVGSFGICVVPISSGQTKLGGCSLGCPAVDPLHGHVFQVSLLHVSHSGTEPPERPEADHTDPYCTLYSHCWACIFIP